MLQSMRYGNRFVSLLWWLGLLLIAAGITITLLQVSFPGMALVGGGVVALGLNALIANDVSSGTTPRKFTARGQVVRGIFETRTGLADLTVGNCDGDKVAQTRFGPFGKPMFEVRDGVAHLHLKTKIFPPNIAFWRADLADNVLWDVDARSFLGSLRFDLSNLRLERIRAHTTMGSLHITPARRGYTQMSLSTRIGEIELHLPEGVGAQVTINTGDLATLTLNSERLLSVGPGRYSTADFESAVSQIEVEIESIAGDVILS